MPWFKVDDGLAFHRKVVAAGNAAMGLWVRAGSWAAHELTNGFVPDHMVGVIGTPAQAQRLVNTGLWTRSDGGFQFHQWNEPGRQPTAAEVIAEREQNAARQAEFRKRRRAQKNLAKATTLQDGRTASEFSSPSDGQVSQSPQVDGSRNGVTPPLVTPLVTGGVTGAPTRPDPTSSPNGEEETHTRASGAKKPRAPRADREHDGFADFWAAYPRKTAKRAAGKAYTAAIDRGAEPAELLTAARRFAAVAAGMEPRFVPHPATWLNQGRYDDEHVQVSAALVRPAVNGTSQRVPTTTQRVRDALALLDPEGD